MLAILNKRITQIEEEDVVDEAIGEEVEAEDGREDAEDDLLEQSHGGWNEIKTRFARLCHT